MSLLFVIFTWKKINLPSAFASLIEVILCNFCSFTVVLGVGTLVYLCHIYC